jgi:hypothetical protein
MIIFSHSGETFTVVEKQVKNKITQNPKLYPVFYHQASLILLKTASF